MGINVITDAQCIEISLKYIKLECNLTGAASVKEVIRIKKGKDSKKSLCTYQVQRPDYSSRETLLERPVIYKIILI
jgi:hypothetical protein